MEKFALLNLLKAIDGLKSVPGEQNEGATPPSTPHSAQPKQPANDGGELPNFMYEALLRHEATSNRIKNKK